MKKLLLFLGLAALISISLCAFNGLFAGNNKETATIEMQGTCGSYWIENDYGVRRLKFKNRCDDRRLRVEYSIKEENWDEWRHYVTSVAKGHGTVELYASRSNYQYDVVAR